jgi:hypothetical protein
MSKASDLARLLNADGEIQAADIEDGVVTAAKLASTLDLSGKTITNMNPSGIYLGGTGAANYLDDYEEGTWTPVVTGGTTAGSASYSVQDGLYVKIGSMVYFRLTVTYTGHTGTGSIGITGIPFSVASGINIFSFACDNFTFPSDTTFAYIGGGASKIDIRYMNSGSSSSAVAMDAAANIYISGSYPTS